MDDAFRTEMAAGYTFDEPVVVFGSPIQGDEVLSEVRVQVPLSRVNRHGLIAGATGTGKTKTLQLLAGQLSAHGVPVFAVDVKGDLSGVGAPGDPANPAVVSRVESMKLTYEPQGHPIEILSLSGTQGAHVRASVSSFGPLLLGKVLDLNDTQTSILSLVFRYCDDEDLPLLDLADLRTTLKFLGSDEGKPVLEDLGGIAPASLGVILRAIVTLEQEGAGDFFGEPEFDPDDLVRTTADGKGIITLLEVADVMDRPRLYSTFVLWMLAQLYETLPEVGDLPKPKLAFFFDEAHLLFADASKPLMEQIERTARLIRSKGVGVYFVTQAPTDVPSSVLSQLGNRVQHALRAFTPDDADALRKTARTFPVTDALRRGADDHLAGHRRGAGDRAVAQGHPDAARGNPARAAGLADGAAHRRGARRERRRVHPRRPLQPVDRPPERARDHHGSAREREGRRGDGGGRGDDARRRVADDRGRARDDDARAAEARDREAGEGAGGGATGRRARAQGPGEGGAGGREAAPADARDVDPHGGQGRDLEGGPVDPARRVRRVLRGRQEPLSGAVPVRAGRRNVSETGDATCADLSASRPWTSRLSAGSSSASSPACSPVCSSAAGRHAAGCPASSSASSRRSSSAGC